MEGIVLTVATGGVEQVTVCQLPLYVTIFGLARDSAQCSILSYIFAAYWLDCAP
jgi:hypothetical protein